MGDWNSRNLEDNIACTLTKINIHDIHDVHTSITGLAEPCLQRKMPEVVI